MWQKPEEQKDFYLIAKRIRNQQKQPPQSLLDDRLQQRYKKQSQQALKMINAYRSVQNVKANPNSIAKSVKVKEERQLQLVVGQPKSSYANKIKQTLKELNADKAKQYKKLSQKQIPTKSQQQPVSLQVNNGRMLAIKKSQQQKRLVAKAGEKFWMIFLSIAQRILKESFAMISARMQANIEQQYEMALRYRKFRLFSLWKQQAHTQKQQNKKMQMQNKQKQIQANEIATQFYVFTTSRKLLRSWIKLTKMSNKKKTYEQELQKIQTERQQEPHIDEINNKNPQRNSSKGQSIAERQQPNQQNSHIPHGNSSNGQLHNKLKGFLSGLKDKIQHKDLKPQQKKLIPIVQLTEQSQHGSHIFSQNPQQNSENIDEFQGDEHDGQQLRQNENPPPSLSTQIQNPKQPLSNQQLLKRRQQINERQKSRKQALDKLKKQKQTQKRKEQQEKLELERKIQQEEKRIKELKYREFQERKKLERQWEERQKELTIRADAWNRLRILKFYGFDKWKQSKSVNIENVKKLKNVVEKVMLHHAGIQLLENLNQNLESILEDLYRRMSLFYKRKLKKKCIQGFKQQLAHGQEQKLHLSAFHEVHTQKIFLSLWKQSLDSLRLQNLEYERPLIKKANEYHKVSLLFKSLRSLKGHAIQTKKQKNINDQKEKIKSKIKNIIKEKIEINYDEFL